MRIITTALIRMALLLVVSLTTACAGPQLYKLASEGNLPRVKEVLAEGAKEVNLKQRDGSTPLFAAASRGYTEVVQTLLAAGAAVNSVDNHGWTALMISAKNGHLEIVRALIAAGAEVNQMRGWAKYHAPLMYAVKSNRTEIVQTLINAGANVNVSDNDSETPLMIAVKNGNIQMVKSLIAAKADVNAQGNVLWGLSPLELANKHNHKDIATALITAGATDAETDIKEIFSKWKNGADTAFFEMSFYMRKIEPDRIETVFGPADEKEGDERRWWNSDKSRQIIYTARGGKFNMQEKINKK